MILYFYELIFIFWLFIIITERSIYSLHICLLQIMELSRNFSLHHFQNLEESGLLYNQLWWPDSLIYHCLTSWNMFPIYLRLIHVVEVDFCHAKDFASSKWIQTSTAHAPLPLTMDFKVFLISFLSQIWLLKSERPLIIFVSLHPEIRQQITQHYRAILS